MDETDCTTASSFFLSISNTSAAVARTVDPKHAGQIQDCRGLRFFCNTHFQACFLYLSPWLTNGHEPKPATWQTAVHKHQHRSRAYKRALALKRACPEADLAQPVFIAVDLHGKSIHGLAHVCKWRKHRYIDVMQTNNNPAHAWNGLLKTWHFGTSQSCVNRDAPRVRRHGHTL